MRDLFLLDPDVVFLNHGSFGATPRSVFETYQRWQLELERQPVEFLGRRYHALMDEVRRELGTYLDADADDLMLVPNATTGINTVARSLDLQPDDEILATDHEYGAIDHTWQVVAEQSGARYVRQPLVLPITTEQSVIDQLWAGVTPRTKVIAISHITSSTALILPIKAICKRARREGILTVIDGAHVPGQIPLNLSDLGADFYTGNCHKWLCAPKGSAFLYIRREHHDRILPLVISWGAYAETLSDRSSWQGTRDIAAFLSIPAAIRFQREHDWHNVRERCHLLAVRTRERVTALTGQPQIAPDWWFAQMFSAILPPACDGFTLKERLYRQHRIELPVVAWGERQLMRVSFQGYNTDADADALIDALQDILEVL